MPMPYCLDAVNALRHAAASKTPIAEVQRLLGWDTATIVRRCKDHGIDLPISCAMMWQDDALRDTPLDRILFQLTPRQAQIFRVLQPHADGEWFAATKIAKRLGGGVTHKMVRMAIVGLARRLERMEADYQVETRLGPGGGFRLVTGTASA